MRDELLEQFLIEGRDQCREAARALEQLATAPRDQSALEACFRAVHTLKGSTGLFDLAPLGAMLHTAEDRLDAARRDGTLGAPDQAALVRVIDLCEAWLENLATHGALPRNAVEKARAASEAFLGATGASQAATDAIIQIRYVPREDAYFMGDDPLAIIAGVPQLADLRLGLREAPPSDLYDPFRCRLVIEAASAAPVEDIRKALALVADQVSLQTATPDQLERPQAGQRTMRLAVERLDEMARLTQELVAARTGLADMAQTVANLPGGFEIANQLSGRLARVERLSNELHSAVGQARLVPFSGLFERLPRLVRALSETLDKSAALTIHGGAIEVDRAVAEGLADPLLHVLRNAMDHGLETPQARVAQGKPATGALSVRASRQGADVAIEVSDDGGGVDLAAVRTRAIDAGLVDAAAAEGLGEDDLIELLFHPGFTTANAATAVSGRGVGMDAVRTAVGRLGGRVHIRSTPGEGTGVTFVMPASIMLTPLALISCAAARYAVPLARLTRTLRMAIDDGVDSIDIAGQTTPVVRLSDRLGTPSPRQAGPRNLILLDSGAALIVDAVHGRLDAAVAPLTGLLAGAPFFIGSAALQDGAAVLVLNTEALI